MTLSYYVENVNYQTGQFDVVMTLNDYNLSYQFDLRVINSPAFVSDKINALCVKCLSAAPFRVSIYYKDRPKEIAKDIYQKLKEAKEKYNRMLSPKESYYG